MELFDSHAHYNDEKFKLDKETILKEIYDSGVTRLTCAGYNLESSKEAVKLAEKYDFIYATVGISPNDVDNYTEENLEEILKLAENKKVVAIGEIGLDYYWNKENKELQQELFKKQIEIANKLNKPIVIHTREAVQDTIDILKNQIKVNKKGIFHCCPLNPELIKEGVKLGFYISFSGNITFKNAKSERAVKEVPLDKILIETDSPYLSPEPLRGKRNDSRNVKYVALKISEILEKEPDFIAKTTYINANKIFEI